MEASEEGEVVGASGSVSKEDIENAVELVLHLDTAVPSRSVLRLADGRLVRGIVGANVEVSGAKHMPTDPSKVRAGFAAYVTLAARTED